MGASVMPVPPHWDRVPVPDEDSQRATVPRAWKGEDVYQVRPRGTGAGLFMEHEEHREGAGARPIVRVASQQTGKA